MEKEIRKWVKALRSGKYKQGNGRLETEDGFCCLGVACKVFIPKSEQFTDSNGKLDGWFPSAQSNAPEWLKNINHDFEGIVDSPDAVNITKNKTRKHVTLPELNDMYNFSFDEIADLLEAVYIYKVFDVISTIKEQCVLSI